MSNAPLPSLRSLWANGGAPGAFVHRDQALTHQLEQLLHTSDTARTMADTDAFAPLMHGFRWDDLLPSDAELDPGVDLREAPARRARPATPPAIPVRDASSHRAPAVAGAPALRAAAREPPHTDPAARTFAHAHAT